MRSLFWSSLDGGGTFEGTEVHNLPSEYLNITEQTWAATATLLLRPIDAEKWGALAPAAMSY
jgi:hypothetical protein